MRSQGPTVRLEGVCKKYAEGEGYHQVLQDLVLHLDSGGCTALLGASGSGKSTLLNVICGIDLPDAGQVEIGGRRLDRLDEKARTLFRRHHIGFVFQFFNLIPTLTVEENLRLPLELKGMADQDDAVGTFLARVGLKDRRRSFPEHLSGGEQQRVAIGRALLHRPTLLLADEPTGNLDAATGERVLELLLELPAHYGTTVLMVTHSPEIAARAGRIINLEGGRLREGLP